MKEKPKVLVVEDDPRFRSIFTDLFAEKNRYDLTILEDANTAIQEMNKNIFIRVITDSLDGGCQSVINSAKNKGVEEVILVSVENLERLAQSLKVRFVWKDDQDSMRRLAD